MLINQKIKNLGVDVIDVARFNKYAKNRADRFLLNNFTKRELDYCFTYKDVPTHLAGTFAAKEAAFKALNKAGLMLSLIEIRRQPSGQPTVWLNNKQQPVLVSISHSANLAIAVAIKI